MSFLLEYCCLNFYYGNIFLHFGLEGVKNHRTKKCFFLPTSTKSAIKKESTHVLRSISHKTVNRNKLKVWKFQCHRLSSFSAITKTVTGVKLFLFSSLISSVHINFQYKLYSCQSLFMIIVNLFSAIALLIFSNLQVHCFDFTSYS